MSQRTYDRTLRITAWIAPFALLLAVAVNFL